jgi:hypothetical protein
MQKLIVVLLLSVLSIQAQSHTIKQEVESVPRFSNVKVGLLGGGEVRGRLVKFEAEELVVRVQEGGTFTDRTIQWNQVTSFKEDKPGWIKRTAGNVGSAVAMPFLVVAWLFLELLGYLGA